MPEINGPENAQLGEIEELEKQLAAKKAAMNIEREAGGMENQIEISQENFPEFQNPVPAATATPAQSAAAKDKKEKHSNVQQDARSIAMMDETRKIETLVALALGKGIDHAVEVANSLQDPYILDMLHDKLIGELHEKLIKEKKLKKL